MKNYLITVECAIEHNDNFLIIKRPTGKHAAGLLSFPGGTVEELDECNNWDILRAAAKREVFEEVGLKLKNPLTYITSNYFVDSNGNHVIHTLFYCMLKQANLEIVASKSEVPEFYWLSQAEINKADNAPAWLKNYVKLIKEHTRRNI